MTKGAMTQKIWMTRDIKAAELFQTCCNVKMENAMRYTGVTEERLCTWKKMGYIVDVYEDKRSYLQTTEKGRAKFEEITGKRPYFCQSYPHDEALAEVRSSLSDTERASWRTEVMQRDYAEANGIDMKGCSVCDGCYTKDDGTTVYVEILTITYTEEQREAKELYVERMGGVYDPHEI